MISTHAPAGGATVVAAVAAVRIRISTHAPAGGATARRGRCRRKGQISTHAPAGGATKHDKGLHDFLLLFLLTPLREGRRIPDNLLPMLRDLFLLTPLREGRRCCRSLPRPTAYPFLLTPLREGRHREGRNMAKAKVISTHAPAGGATGPAVCKDGGLRQFLLTPLREGRRGH